MGASLALFHSRSRPSSLPVRPSTRRNTTHRNAGQARGNGAVVQAPLRHRHDEAVSRPPGDESSDKVDRAAADITTGRAGRSLPKNGADARRRARMRSIAQPSSASSRIGSRKQASASAKDGELRTRRGADHPPGPSRESRGARAQKHPGAGATAAPLGDGQPRASRNFRWWH